MKTNEGLLPEERAHGWGNLVWRNVKENGVLEKMGETELFPICSRELPSSTVMVVGSSNIACIIKVPEIEAQFAQWLLPANFPLSFFHFSLF